MATAAISHPSIDQELLNRLATTNAAFAPFESCNGFAQSIDLWLVLAVEAKRQGLTTMFVVSPCQEAKLIADSQHSDQPQSRRDYWTEFGYRRAVVVRAGCDQDACWMGGRPLNEFGTIGAVAKDGPFISWSPWISPATMGLE